MMCGDIGDVEMGKPYGHEYHFIGDGTQKGLMVCASCNQPIFGHNQDWMSYQKTYRDEDGWEDWKYVCFHRKCSKDQSGWEKIEKENDKAERKARLIKEKLQKVASEIGVTCPYDFAELAADALGESDLSGHYFSLYGSS